MARVVDTSVLLDIRLNNPSFGVASATCLAQHLGDGLIICPVSYIELAPAFRGDPRLQQTFLRQVGVDWREAWTWQDSETAHRLVVRSVSCSRRCSRKSSARIFILIRGRRPTSVRQPRQHG